jgi:hypothetical protein
MALVRIRFGCCAELCWYACRLDVVYQGALLREIAYVAWVLMYMRMGIESWCRIWVFNTVAVVAISHMWYMRACHGCACGTYVRTTMGVHIRKQPPYPGG